MAIFYTDISAVQAGNVNVLANLQDPNLTFGRVKLVTAVYTMTGAEVANDLVYIARVPSGSLVNPIDGNVASEAVATTATIKIGDSDTQGGTVSPDVARYSTSLNIAAGNTTVGFPFTGGTTVNAPAEITDDWVWLMGQFATLATPVAGKKIVFRIKVSSLD